MENVTGGSGNDTLSGDAQANVLIGGAGHDTVSGDAGDDTLIVTALAGAEADGGAGVDTLIVRGTEGRMSWKPSIPGSLGDVTQRRG